MTVRVVLADDQALVRSGIRMILEVSNEIEVVGEAEDGDRAIALVNGLAPDLVLMDIRMPRVNGVEATRRLVRAGCASRIVMLTTFDQDEHVYDALVAGASGFLVKSTPPALLVEAVLLAAAGETLFSATVTRRLIEHYVDRPRPDGTLRGRFAELTERELDVLRNLAEGCSNVEIAASLLVSEATVKSHVTHILQKLGLRDRVQAVIAAYESGVVVPRATPRADPP